MKTIMFGKLISFQSLQELKLGLKISHIVLYHLGVLFMDLGALPALQS